MSVASSKTYPCYAKYNEYSEKQTLVQQELDKMFARLAIYEKIQRDCRRSHFKYCELTDWFCDAKKDALVKICEIESRIMELNKEMKELTTELNDPYILYE